MSKNITNLNTGQGLTANLMTAFLVLVASRMGFPVSTTHVSCGAIFSIGLVNGERKSINEQVTDAMKQNEREAETVHCYVSKKENALYVRDEFKDAARRS